MKKFVFYFSLLLIGIIIYIPKNVFAAYPSKTCTYSNGETITIYTDNTAKSSSGTEINWSNWKKSTGNQIICPKYIIMANPIGVGNNIKSVKEYSEKYMVNYYGLEDKNKSTQNSALGKTTEEDSVAWLIKKILGYIRIAGPVIVIVLTSIDYLRALAQSDDETMAKINKKLGTRILLVILLFIIPTLVNVVLSLVNYDTSNIEDFE